jgi:hypothetical protein
MARSNSRTSSAGVESYREEDAFFRGVRQVQHCRRWSFSLLRRHDHCAASGGSEGNAPVEGDSNARMLARGKAELLYSSGSLLDGNRCVERSARCADGIVGTAENRNAAIVQP